MITFLAESGIGVFHVYLGCLTFGLGYAVIVTLLGSLGGSDHHGGDASGDDVSDFSGHHFDSSDADHAGHDSDGGDHGMSPFSPLMIATFATLFGGLGLIMLGLFGIFKFVPTTFSGIASIVLSAPLAIVFTSYFSLLLVKLFVKTETTTSISSNRMIGNEVEATLDIEPGKTGEVTYLMGGSHQTAMARLIDGAASIKKGCMAEVVSISQNIFWVKPADKKEEIV
ncbi:MAG: hypothetical protein HQM10_14865 [Candidatus Riflebacteria bacterium]|nr:hypothetical protein [Candidatus Riflebacteria bacterium]